MIPTFPRGRACGFWSFNRCVSLFKGVGYELLEVMVRDELSKGIRFKDLIWQGNSITYSRPIGQDECPNVAEKTSDDCPDSHISLSFL